jgi:hypothetical protein
LLRIPLGGIIEQKKPSKKSRAKKEPDFHCDILLQWKPGQECPNGRQKKWLEAR